MKLYFAPFACSMSPHIALREAGLSFTTEKVDLASKTTESGADYLAINPKGYVPALEIEPGVVLTEGPAIVQYIADQKPESGLAPKAGTLARYRLAELLNFISTEVHKQFSPLWNPAISAEARKAAVDILNRRLPILDTVLAKQPYLTGETFSVADGYLFTVLNWSPFVKFDLNPFPALGAFQARVAGRPAVQATIAAEAAARTDLSKK
jgi:glutathione S-transferase